MRILKAIGRFWYDFVIGDDPKIAAAVLLALGAAAVLLLAGLPRRAVTPLGAVLVAAAFLAALALDVRRSRRG